MQSFHCPEKGALNRTYSLTLKKMSMPFLANLGLLIGDDKYFDGAVRQILQMAERLDISHRDGLAFNT
jgi:hypothetical protein